MTQSDQILDREALSQLAKQWWETPVVDADEDGFDAEMRAINALALEIEAFPKWALELRDAMPKWGFEMCAHRWLDGLDHMLRLLAEQRYSPCQAGRCGDVPGRIVAGAEVRAAAMERWAAGQPASDAIQTQIWAWLGEPTEAKIEAAQCFVDLVRVALFGGLAREAWVAQVTAWQARIAENPIVGAMLAQYGLQDALDNHCGLLFLDKLDLFVRLVGGDEVGTRARIYNCNSQLRFMWQEQPERYTVTQGYLWGLYAYLRGHGEEWLRIEHPECAGAALYALQAASRAGQHTPLQRWLVASLLKATEVWCRRAMARSPEGLVPSWAYDLPRVAEVL